MSPDDQPLLEVDRVALRFARRLGPSLRLGALDTLRDLAGLPPRAALARDEFWALDDVSFQLRRGEALGLLGANGAGKSSLLKIVAGLIKPARGSVTVRGRVGALIELGAGMHPLLTGRENIRVNAAILGLTRRETESRIDEIIAFADLGEFIDAPVRGYSSGMRVRLGFAVAAHLEPDLLLIDEVLAVGDASFRMRCFSRIIKLKAAGTAIVLVTHQLPDVSRVCDRVIVMAEARKTADTGVASGIAAYEASLASRRSSEGVDMVNSAGVRVRSARILNAEGREAGEFQTNDEINVELLVECAEPVRGGRLRLYIESPRAGLLSGFSTAAAGLAVDLVPPSSRIRLRIPRNPFKVGAYSIGVGVFDATKVGLLFNRPGITSFQITGPSIPGFGLGDDGVLQVEHQWQLP
jgi:lipopolysaccharide transport system ATP-binding protein